MSSQSGIKATDELLDAIKTFVAAGHAGSLLIRIDRETLVAGEFISGPIDAVQAVLKDGEPAYVLHRDDAGTTTTLISYVPDQAAVRSKMVYASTRNTVTRAVSAAAHVDNSHSVFATDRADVSTAGLARFAAHAQLEQPLTREEEALQAANRQQAVEHSTVRRAHVSSGLSLPLTSAAQSSLDRLQQQQQQLGGRDGLRAVVLKIDHGHEQVDVDAVVEGDDGPETDTEAVLEQLRARLSQAADAPRYAFVRVAGSVAFVYVCPQAAPVRQRMVYAASRAVVAGHVRQLSRKVEVGHFADVTADAVTAAAPASSGSSSNRFARPKAPFRRGR
ncbi:hypothetical protein V1514DRAFT_321813 [Lipomyces japonicus]|uniref:uncharacterized protein n=1 Tax=Lipomyces japonicus TaxID=56871 RepID=UPI0034CD0B5C